MGINKAENSLDKQLVNRIIALERAMRELKTALQPIGADVLNVQPLPTGGYAYGGPVTLPAGQSTTFYAVFTPDSSILTLWNILASVYVDTNNPNNQFPNGSALSAGQLNMRQYMWIDFGDSSDFFNSRVFKVRIENTDTASHDYYVRIRAYLPTLSGSTTS